MTYLLDSSIAVDLREGVPEIVARVDALAGRPFISVVTRVELEGGVYSQERNRDQRRNAVDALLEMLPQLDFDFEMAATYGRILDDAGFNRRKIIDRMIAATALVADLTLITANGIDFTDIEGLKLEIWES